ncbi:MAG: heparinase II/III-family protein, partial [Bacteroidales bacterium]|nr:heparinase II/III-family protein [Bacteroidales bacterium]
YQIADDGTFIQDSMNYHRVFIQLLTWAIALADKNGEKFSDFVYERAYKSVNFLYQCQDLPSGWLPNYGANDGALFFPLSDNDYRDYRSQLDALYGLLTGRALYGKHLEDAHWVGSTVPSFRKAFVTLSQKIGLVSFEKSGYYLIREQETLTFIRCGLFNGKGSCTDELHLDVWYKRENELIDGGSYKYNTEEELEKYFRGTESQNTVMLDGYDQMLKGPRFVWYYPPKIVDVSLTEKDDFYEFKGSVKCFSYLGNITLTRVITKKKGEARWKVEDSIMGKPEGMSMRQLWHTISDDVVFEAVSSSERKESVKPYSFYYGVKDDCIQTEFTTKGSIIRTNITIK